MKKFLWLVVILFSVAASAEDVQLVTVLPSPVGSFVRLDTASTKKKAEFTSVQFGNENAAGGEIELVGGSTSSVYKITLDQGTTLKSNDETLANMTKANVVVTVQAGGTLKGGRLFANTLQLKRADDSKIGLKASTLYIANNALNVKVASVSTLSLTHNPADLTTIKDLYGNSTRAIPGGGFSTAISCWSNEDVPAGTTGRDKKFLLTSHCF